MKIRLVVVKRMFTISQNTNSFKTCNQLLTIAILLKTYCNHASEHILLISICCLITYKFKGAAMPICALMAQVKILAQLKPDVGTVVAGTLHEWLSGNKPVMTRASLVPHISYHILARSAI